MRRSILPAAGLLASILLAAGCSTHKHITQAQADRAVQSSFATPEAAVDEFVAASRKEDDPALLKLLGPGGKEIIDSGDEAADANARGWFIQAYDQKHELTVADDKGARWLVVGNDQWPIPIPLTQVSPGLWHFDTAAGRDEVLNRRIGHNELAAINVCKAIADAQHEYAAMDPDHDNVPSYAALFSSSPGKHDGLYWPTKDGEPQSPLGELFDDAAEKGFAATGPAINAKRPYYGYFYRILKSQGPAAPGGSRDYVWNNHLVGGFAIVAWPAEYGSTGVMTFLVGADGVVYQRNLAEETAKVGETIKEFDPTKEWEKCEP